jgi:hypothetical protein
VAEFCCSSFDSDVKVIETVHICCLTNTWKIRSFFQGYKNGAAGLLTVHVMPEADVSSASNLIEIQNSTINDISFAAILSW